MGDYIDLQNAPEVDDVVPDLLRPARRSVHPGQWGVAAPCNTEDFKTRSQKHKPPAKDWSRKFFSFFFNFLYPISLIMSIDLSSRA